MEKNERETTEVFLKWGSRKRLRCVRLRHDEPSSHRIPRKISYSSHFLTPKDNLFPRLTRNSESAILRKSSSSGSPEKEEKSYTTRGGGGGCVEEISKVDCCEKKRVVWPKLYVSLSNKEKEEDFMAMKGCKLPQRPKKRAKLIQRTLLLVSPGAWLTDMSIERYEVREKKSSKKRPRGLKAMGSVDSDSE